LGIRKGVPERPLRGEREQSWEETGKHFTRSLVN
jgi:hypothetical protein